MLPLLQIIRPFSLFFMIEEFELYVLKLAVLLFCFMLQIFTGLSSQQNTVPLKGLSHIIHGF